MGGKNGYKRLHCLILKDHRLLKLVFIVFGSLLILSEFYTSWVIRPTYTSTSKRNIEPRDFPEILLCPKPAINIDAAHAEGYWSLWDYYMGSYDFWRKEELDWRGKVSMDINNASENISFIKSTEDCPESIYWYKDSQNSAQIGVNNYTMAKALYPFHKCCQVIPPAVLRQYPVIGMELHLEETSSSFQLFMQDQLTSSYFDQNKEIMLGDSIISVQDSIVIYKVKIKEDVNIENDPQFPCIDYKNTGDYAKCVENEVVKQNSRFLNCTPPWMSNVQDLWCKECVTFDSRDLYSNYITFLDEIMVSGGDYRGCGSRYFNKWIWAKNLKRVETFRK